MDLRKTRTANFLTDTLSGVKDKHRCLFHTNIYIEKIQDQIKKKETAMALPVSPKVY